MPTVVDTPATLDREQVARRFHALSDPTRLAILDSLAGGECCVCDLQSSLDVAQSRLSFHLRVLREAGLIAQRKDGRWSWYQIIPGAFADAAEALLSLGRNMARGLPLYPYAEAVKGAVVREGLPLADASGCCG